MNDLQFLKYVPVEGEKHLGIAYVRWLGKIILLFKVSPSTNGNGYWIAAGAAKIGVKHDGKDNYQEWFQVDSTFDREEIKDFILRHVTPLIAQSSGSVYHAKPAVVQPQQQYAPQQQAVQQTFAQNPTSNYYDNPPF